jgi:ketosteroid isomerase-like protein
MLAWPRINAGAAMTKPETIISDIYDAWRAQDLNWLASYLPEDFCHVMNFPADLHPLAGEARGKARVIQRWRLYIEPLEFLRFDTSSLMVGKDRAAVEIPLHYRHKETGCDLVTTKANFWTLEDGWPVRLTEYYDVRTLERFSAQIIARIEA